MPSSRQQDAFSEAILNLRNLLDDAAAAQAKADTEAAEAAILAGLQNEEARANAAQLLTGVSRTIRDTVTVRLPLYSDLTIAKELSLSIPIVKAIRLLANQ